jgi:hypothetical protein
VRLGKYFEHKKEEDCLDKVFYETIPEKVSDLFINKHKEHIDALDKSITVDQI